jgi:hypothetical protein
MIDRACVSAAGALTSMYHCLLIVLMIGIRPASAFAASRRLAPVLT